MEEDKRYAFLVELVHPTGLQCPDCQTPSEKLGIHCYNRAPLFLYRCPCGCYFNVWTGTMLQGTRWRPSIWVQVLRGFAQGTPTLRFSKEIGLLRMYLTAIRHKCQGFLAFFFPPEGSLAGFNGRDGRNVSECRRKRRKT